MSKNYSKSGVSRLHYSNHGELFAAALVSNLRQSSFADVKIICADGSVWAHRVVLAAVSPVLRYVFDFGRNVLLQSGLDKFRQV